MSVFRSNKQMYVQIIDDISGKTLAAASSLGITEKMPKKEQAAKVGEMIAKSSRLLVLLLLFSTVMVICIMGELKRLLMQLVTVDLNFNHYGRINNRVKVTNDIELKDRLVAINRVTKVTKGGRTFSFSAIVVVGNEDGIIGWGLGKAGEVTDAIAKGVESAKKNLIKVPVIKGTVPHEQVAKFGGAEVFIKPASQGTGVVAGGAMRAVLESVGITDVLAKSKGSSNPHNLVKATILSIE
jgi:small subunit ribosomal protein S5